MNPWAELGVKPGASPEQIRRAFRSRVKELHPDSGGEPDRAGERISRLVEAYRLLLEGFKSGHYHFATPIKPFDYREFLQERHDPRSRAKLVRYELNKGRDEEAIRIYLEVELLHHRFVLKHLDRDEAMDTLLMLGQAFRRQGDFWRSLDVLVLLAEEERRLPTLGLIYEEVEEALHDLILHHVPPTVELQEHLFQIRRVLPHLSDARRKLTLQLKAAVLARQHGDEAEAQRWIQEAQRSCPNHRQLSRLLSLWGMAGLTRSTSLATPPG